MKDCSTRWHGAEEYNPCDKEADTVLPCNCNCHNNREYTDDPQGEIDRDNMRAIGLSAGSKIQLNEQ